MRLQPIKRRRHRQPPKNPLWQSNPNHPQQFLQHSRYNQWHNDHEERLDRVRARIVVDIPQNLSNGADDTLDKPLSRLCAAAGGRGGARIDGGGGALAAADAGAGAVDVGVGAVVVVVVVRGHAVDGGGGVFEVGVGVGAARG